MKDIVNYLTELGYSNKNPFGHKVDNIVDMIRECKNEDEQGLFYDYEFYKLKSMILAYDREITLNKVFEDIDEK
jgi:hypothetical protein